MSSDLSLDQVWSTYRTARDCFRVAQLAVTREIGPVLEFTEFVGASVSEAEDQIRVSRENSEDLAILAVWVAFERHLVELVQGKAEKLREVTPRRFGDNLYGKVETEAERWKVAALLRLFRGLIDPALLEQANDIKKYRDWVAHKNPKRPSPKRADPRSAFDALSAVLDALGQSVA